MAILPGSLLSLGLLAAKGIGGFVRVARNRRQVRALAQWDDRALKDIGLSRSDLSGALSLALGQDPTVHLASLSGRSPRTLTRDAPRAGASDAVMPASPMSGSLPDPARPFLSA